MAVVTLTATKRGVNAVPGQGLSSGVHALVRTVEVGSADSSTSTYDCGNIPSNARILGLSKISWDDLSAAGSPTIDIGLFAVNSNITNDDDALNDGLDVAASASSASVVKDIANYGKRAWEFVNGQTTDPAGLLNVKITLKDADVNTGGTITIELLYIID